MSKYILLTALMLVLVPSSALAHSTVSPSQTGTSKYETFTVTVPTEKDVPTIRVRLAVPDSLDRVTPLVKPGWRITVTKDAAGKVSQIEWSGGSIPPDQKDLFQFSARTPQAKTTLIWKAYQTYQNGMIVAWDQAPHDPSHESKDHEATITNPYSTTEVKEDVALAQISKQTNWDDKLPLALSLAALAISLVALKLKRAA